LRSSGLRVVSNPGHEIYLCEPAQDDVSERARIVAQELASITGHAMKDGME
jgi:hypothetical protein